MTPAIDNDSEFYPHHYLTEVLDSDLAGVRGRWSEAASASPPQRLAALARDFAGLRASAEHAPPSPDDIAAFHAQLVEALGYQRVMQALALPDRPAEAPGLPTLAQLSCQAASPLGSWSWATDSLSRPLTSLRSLL